MTNKTALQGVYLPLVTPFLRGEVDDQSIRNLCARYVDTGVAGVVLLGTTGESPVLNAEESRHIVELVFESLQGHLPLFMGVAGNDTRNVVADISGANDLPIEGYLLTAPYYNRPSQSGIALHFDAAATATDKSIVVYNIPYRTGVNITNRTLLNLAEKHSNIIGVKDSCGDFRQSLELLRDGRNTLSVLTGEDHLYFATLALGGAGGILASSHIQTEKFVEVFHLMAQNNREAALNVWNTLSPWVPTLFEEPNPAPLKVWLADQGLIESAECRLPLAPLTPESAAKTLKTLPKRA